MNSIAKSLVVPWDGSDRAPQDEQLRNFLQLQKVRVDHVVQSPKLVIVGDQESRKSSLMSALAGISFQGCDITSPVHIKTAEADHWTCTISLLQSYSYEPLYRGSVGSKDITDERPFYPWHKQPLVVKEFITINERSKFDEAFRWAQIATLNHNKPYTLFVPGSANFVEDKTTNAEFSPNLVSIDICGPGLVPLSYFNLPGTFQNASQERDSYRFRAMKNLIREYIKHPQTLIICALPTSFDPASSWTLNVIAELEATSRCWGVVKDDSQQDGDTYNHLKGTLQSQPVFAMQSPWTTKPVYVANFATNLSREFAMQIVQYIPNARIKILQRTAEIESLTSSSLSQYVFQQKSQLFILFQSCLDSRCDGLWSELCKQFQKEILSMKPNIKLSGPEVIDLDSAIESSSTNQALENLQDIQLLISSFSTTNDPSSAKTSLKAARKFLTDKIMKQVTPSWGVLSSNMINATLQIIRSQAKIILQQNMSGLQSAQFLEFVEHLNTVLDRSKESQIEKAKGYLQSEQTPFTSNKEALDKYYQEELQKLQQTRKALRTQRLVQNQKKNQCKTPSKRELSFREAVAVGGERLWEDPFSEELKLLAHLLGYYDLAALRFADTICMSINKMLFEDVKLGIEELLNRGSNVDIVIKACLKLEQESLVESLKLLA